ncbi:MAG: LLM class flavin-dependent oxidoreductase, partial [Halobacteria archaeon]|nr:LLM class flavin-dependent oxidoreductase [Halobacteria archaeon]
EKLEKFAAIDGLDAVAVSFPREATRDEIDTTLRKLSPSDE